MNNNKTNLDLVGGAGCKIGHTTVAPNPNPSVTITTEKRCRDTGSKEGWACSLQDGHKGDHVAFPLHDHNRGILEQWSASPKLPVKVAPESEDEAFEEWWHIEAYYGTKADRAIAWEAWNARARLDVERGK